jgi:hypothetical protein
MRSWIAFRLFACAALCLPAACTVEQILIGQIYRITTPPVGSCPTLQWQFFVDAERQVHGQLSEVNAPPLATLSGTLAPTDQFDFVATNIATHQTATASGAFTSGTSVISIHGRAIYPGCDNQTFHLRLGPYFARQGGGGGGR